jgi:hypothetical protein
MPKSTSTLWPASIASKRDRKPLDPVLLCVNVCVLLYFLLVLICVRNVFVTRSIRISAGQNQLRLEPATDLAAFASSLDLLLCCPSSRAGRFSRHGGLMITPRSVRRGEAWLDLEPGQHRRANRFADKKLVARWLLPFRSVTSTNQIPTHWCTQSNPHFSQVSTFSPLLLDSMRSVPDPCLCTLVLR